MTERDGASLLSSDRKAWERYGAMPGDEHLALCLHVADADVVDEQDLVFLWISWAFVTCNSDDEASLERQVTLEELTERLAARAFPVSSRLDELAGRVLDRRSGGFLGGSFALEDGTRLQLERSVLPDGRGVLAGRAYRPDTDGLEVVLIAGSGWQIRSFPRGTSLRPLATN